MASPPSLHPATSPSSSSSPLLELSLAVIPVLPKPEPLDPDFDPPVPRRASTSISDWRKIFTPLQTISSSSDEDALFSEYFRLAQIYHSSNNSSLLPSPPNSAALSIVPSSSASDVNSTSIVIPTKKRKPRSSELVRISRLSTTDQIHFRDVVRRARITFESLRSLLVHEHDLLPGSSAASGDHHPSRRGFRPDMHAAALMGDRDLWLNRDRRIVGPIPGVAIGDAFLFRMELCILGLHGQVQAGIDYVPPGRSETGEPIATSIIVSGGYEDDLDNGDMLIYTGHGGRDPSLHKHCVSQRLEGGNLALERSMFYGIEIRVIRGVKYKRSPVGKIYVYDGLYKVIECWSEKGKAGFDVYKYKMLRIEGQEEMGSVTLRFAEQLKLDPLSVRPRGYLTRDISIGRERFPVLLFNDIDDDHDPLMFEYLARPVFPSSAMASKFAEAGGGCDCTTDCSDNCYCWHRNGNEFAYDKSGTLLRGKPVIYECGPHCRCPPTCPNRVSQKGLTSPFEIFRSRETGWGVRTLDVIRAGTFICEFSGIVLTQQQAELFACSESLVRPNRLPPRWADWGDISDVLPEHVPTKYPAVPELTFSIDVSRARNVACYISHSCSPNAFFQHVLFDHYNPSYPHLMIFALETIPPLREISIDYGVIDQFIETLML